MSPTLLFTAFEPSGDAHAGAVIAELLRRRPELAIYAMGGAKCEAAGASLIEWSTDRAAMLGAALGQVAAHRRRLARLRSWLEAQALDMLVPVDSPAANWSICKAVRRRRPAATILHLVAPQLWAWAPWRIGKLRRLSDGVLALLPFEPDWFNPRGVPCDFVGHPAFTRPPGEARPFEATGAVLALLPGSREAEVRVNGPTMLRAFTHLLDRVPELRGRVAARDAQAATRLQEAARRAGIGWPEPLAVHVGPIHDVLDESRAALVVSGTASLEVAAHGTPMVTLYGVSRWSWHLLGRWLIRAPAITLPNLVGHGLGLGSVIPEFIPHFGDARGIADALEPLVSRPAAHATMQAALGRIAEPFAGRDYAAEAAGHILARLDS